MGGSMGNKENMVTLGDFLKRTGLNEDDLKHTKIIRYSLDDPEIRKLYETGNLCWYHSIQKESDFKGCKYLFCFIGESTNTARLLNSYEVDMKIPASEKRKEMPEDYPFPEHFEDERPYYYSWPSDLFHDFDQRLVVKWTSKKSQLLANSQTALNIPVITTRTLVASLLLKNTSVAYSELNEIFKEDNWEWRSTLSKINAVYFVYSNYGKYIGASYGKGGLWECWKKHIEEKDKFAGVKLKNKSIYKDFTYRILEILPIDVSRDTAIWRRGLRREGYKAMPNFYKKRVYKKKV